MTVKYKTLTHVVDLKLILAAYAAELKVTDPNLEEINVETFVDQAKGKAIFHINCKDHS